MKLFHIHSLIMAKIKCDLFNHCSCWFQIMLIELQQFKVNFLNMDIPTFGSGMQCIGCENTSSNFFKSAFRTLSLPS